MCCIKKIIPPLKIDNDLLYKNDRSEKLMNHTGKLSIMIGKLSIMEK